MESERTVSIQIEDAAGVTVLTGEVNRLSLDDVMYHAYESEINVGVQTIWPHGVIAMIGHIEGEPTATEQFTLEQLADVPAWMDAAIRERYPDSIYVKGEAWTRS